MTRRALTAIGAAMIPTSPRNSRDDPFRHFADVVLASDISSTSLSRLQACGRRIRVTRKKMANVDGSDRRTIIFVSEGAVKLVGHVGAEREQIVAFAFRGDILLLSAPSHKPYTGYALHSLNKCSLLAFPATDLIMSTIESPDASDAILERFFAALDRARETAILLGRKTAREKLASFLVSMAERIGHIDGDTIYLDLPMSRREIGDSLGLTIETISRQLTALRNLKIIKTTDRSKIVILDMASLRDFAALDPCVS